MTHFEHDKDQISENLRRIAAEMTELQKKLDALRRQITNLEAQAERPPSSPRPLSGGCKGDGAAEV